MRKNRTENICSPWRKFLGSFFYLGNLKGGGTYTSIIGAGLLYYSLRWNSILYIGLLVGITILAVLLSFKLEDDPSWFTLDELAGIIVTFTWHNKTIPILIIGLIVFRLFDIFKAPFIKSVESNRFGIVLDDIIAGALANGFLWIIVLLRIF